MSYIGPYGFGGGYGYPMYPRTTGYNPHFDGYHTWNNTTNSRVNRSLNDINFIEDRLNESNGYPRAMGISPSNMAFMDYLHNMETGPAYCPPGGPGGEYSEGAQPQQQGPTAGSVIGNVAGGAAAGAAVGLLLGPAAPFSVPVCAAIGAGIGLVKGLLGW